MPDTRIRIAEIDESHSGVAVQWNSIRDVPAGEPGEMLINGPQIMQGYFANPEQSRIALITDNEGNTWLRTGDIVRVAEDGYFHVLDRKKDMIIRSGLKVYPAKIENVLLRHVRVADAAVIGRADEVHTEIVVAFIALKKQRKPAAPLEADRQALVNELKTMCREHLAPYEVPQEVRFVDAIPRSALGKVLKKELRQLPDELPEPPNAGAPKPSKPQKQKKAA
jgi:long-chain acyl-CoA synthetase